MTPGRTQRPHDTHAGSRQAGAVPLKQERARATLASIEATAVRLWNASGYDRVSVDAICDAAGISKGAFYFHFASKAELLHAVAVPDTARLVERTREALDDGTPPDLILVGQIVTWVADDIRQVPASLVERAVLDLLAGAPIDPNTDRARRFLLREAFGLVFRAAQQGGSLPPTFPPGELAAVATWSTLQGILFWSRGVYGRRGLTTILWQRAQMIWHGGSLESLDPDCPRTRPTGSANG